MILTITARELRGLFVSPLAWTLLAVVQLLLGYLFLVQLESFLGLQAQLNALPRAPGVTELVVAPFYANAGAIFLLIAPLLTMRLISEERRSGSFVLLRSAPVSSLGIVLGKFLGVLLFFLLMTLLISLMPLSLLLGTSLDLGRLAAAALGLLLLLAAFTAAGLFASALSPQPSLAALAGFGILLLFWVLDWAGEGPQATGPLLAYLSLFRHYRALLSGLIDTRDLVYFCLFVFTFLALTVRQLEALRLSR